MSASLACPLEAPSAASHNRFGPNTRTPECPPPSRYRIGFDIGGTFTDFILLDTQRNDIRLHKCLTTPHDPSVGALEGLAELLHAAQLTLADIGDVVHGTTLVTNALIERSGARLGLITTRGFRDILEMGTEQRYDIYDLFLQFPDPLVPRRHRLEVAERMDRDGNVLTPLDPAEVRATAQRLVADGIEAIAICFLHAYRNPTHERAAANIVRAAFPDIAVSISSDVVAELWEYQRCNTTCANAYVQPLMGRYIAKLERELHARGFRGDLRFMHSAGGLLSPETARDFPIRMLESGPAGGGLATAFFGAAAGKPDVISFDMGGTTAKACLIENGRAEIAPMMEAARVHRFKKGSGLPIKAPVIDMIEIGAGGGSIASIDEVGLLRVGPHSAGADPGPACYARGGTEPTVTDANLLLGYYDPGFFLGGRMALDRDAAERALATVGEKLGPDRDRHRLGHPPHGGGEHGRRRAHPHRGKGQGSARLRDGRLRRRRSRTRRGGGARPGRAQVLIPPASGAASALGFLAAPLSFEQVRSHPVRLEAPGAAAIIDAILHELSEAARARLPGEDGNHRASGRHAPGRPDARDQRRAAGRSDHRRDAAGDPRGVRHRLCGTIYVGVCRRRRDGGLVPCALPRPAAASLADRGRRALRRRGAEGNARGVVRRRLR